MPSRQEAIMNTRIGPTLFSLFSAALVTFTMLASVDTLATSQPTAAQVARVTSSTASV
jgi:hypothetical protein